MSGIIGFVDPPMKNPNGCWLSTYRFYDREVKGYGYKVVCSADHAVCLHKVRVVVPAQPT